MKQFGLFLMLLLISCSNGDDSLKESNENTFQNRLEVNYLGYWENRFGEGNKTMLFDKIEIIKYVEEISSTEEIELLKVIASIKDDPNFSPSKVRFTIIANTTGQNALYMDEFYYKLFAPTYLLSNPKLNFNVTTNNNDELRITFSGNLKHWNEGTQILQILKINGANLIYTY